MQPANHLDAEAKRIIETTQRQLTETRNKAMEKLDAKQIDEAIDLLYEARSLSIFVDKGLKVRILNEDSDAAMHNELTRMIEKLELTGRLS